MSMRAIWILSSSPEWRMVFSRKFATVERRARKLMGNAYVEIPFEDTIIVQAILQQIGLETNSNRFDPNNSCRLIKRMPVIGINTKDDKKVWPVVIVEHYGNLLCCLPFIEDLKHEHEISSLLEIPSISTAFAILLAIQNFLSQTLKFDDCTVAELNSYVTKTMPFGRPSETNPDMVKSALQSKPILVPNHYKQPSEKPQLTSKPRCTITVSEYVRCNQYNKQLQGVIDIYGTVNWKGYPENTNSDMTMVLSSLQNLVIDSFVVHPSVSYVESDTVHSKCIKKLRFHPVSNDLTLCHYTVNMNQDNFPIYGNYKMRYDDQADFLIQLNLNKNMKNNFDCCVVNVSFREKHIITSVNVKPAWGIVSLSDDKRKISWTIGQKFPSKSNEISLEGTFTLSKPFSSSEEKNSFMSNSYASLLFHIPGYTFSGFDINAKNIQMSPTTKTKIVCEKEFRSSEYILWNSYGTPPVGFRESQIRFAENCLN